MINSVSVIVCRKSSTPTDGANASRQHREPTPVKSDAIDLPQDLSIQRSSYQAAAGTTNAVSAHSNALMPGIGFSGNGVHVNRSALSPIQAHMQSPFVASQHRSSLAAVKNSWPKDEIQVQPSLSEIPGR